MLNFMSFLLLLSMLVFVVLFGYKQYLQCRVLALQLPKPKKKKVKKIVVKDDLDEE